MKCNQTVYWQTYPSGKRVCLGTIPPAKTLKGTITSEKCQGDIEINIWADDEAYYGGHSATLYVDCHCNVCGLGYYPDRNLPTPYTINAWINNILKGLP